jgi:hypothetical protein
MTREPVNNGTALGFSASAGFHVMDASPGARFRTATPMLTSSTGPFKPKGEELGSRPRSGPTSRRARYGLPMAGPEMQAMMILEDE